MAFGAERLGAGSLALTIHIWPSRELASRSWHWPERWHESYARAAGLLGLAAATCILEGHPLGDREVRLPQSVGGLRFVVARKGDSIFITVLEFTGPGRDPDPHPPGTNGGLHQPGPADGLVLGLRGSGRYYRLVVFVGFMPHVPAIDILRGEILALFFSEQNSFRETAYSFANGDIPAVAADTSANPNLQMINTRMVRTLSFSGAASRRYVGGISWSGANDLSVLRTEQFRLKSRAIRSVQSPLEAIIPIQQLPLPRAAQWNHTSLRELHGSWLKIRPKRNPAPPEVPGQYLH